MISLAKLTDVIKCLSPAQQLLVTPCPNGYKVVLKTLGARSRIVWCKKLSETWVWTDWISVDPTEKPKRTRSKTPNPFE